MPDQLHPACAVVPGTDGVYVYTGAANRTFRLDGSLLDVLKAVDRHDKATLEELESSFGPQWERLLDRLRNEDIVVNGERKRWRVWIRRISYRLAYLLPVLWVLGIAAGAIALFDLSAILDVLAETARRPLWLLWFVLLGPLFIGAHEVSHGLCLSMVGGRAGRMRLQPAWPLVVTEMGPIQQATRGRAVLVVTAGMLTEVSLLGGALLVLANRPGHGLAAFTLGSITWLVPNLCMNLLPLLPQSDGRKLRALLGHGNAAANRLREAEGAAATPAPAAANGRADASTAVAEVDGVRLVSNAAAAGIGVVARLASVSKRFGKNTALDDVSLVVRAGEVVALLGPNGAGKTTALSLMLGLRRADSGRVRLFRKDPRNWRARRLIGVTAQETNFPNTLRVQEIVELVRVHYRDPVATAEVLKRFGLTGLERRQAGGLSGGQRRRLAVALAFVGRPQAVFLDEPTAGLDVASRRQLFDAVRTYVAAGGTLLLTTHDLREAEELATRVIVLHRGRILTEGSVGEIRARAGLTRIQFRGDEVPPLTGVERAERQGSVQTLFARDGGDVVRQLVLAGVPLYDLEVRPSSLEEAFLAMTQDEA